MLIQAFLDILKKTQGQKKLMPKITQAEINSSEISEKTLANNSRTQYFAIKFSSPKSSLSKRFCTETYRNLSLNMLKIGEV